MNSTVSGADPAALQSLVDGLWDVQITRVCRLSAICIILYDYALTFDDEINVMWRRGISLVKIIWFLNRYYVIVAALIPIYAFFSPNITTEPFLMQIRKGIRFMYWQGMTGVIGVMLSQAILQIRIYALYSMSKKLLAFMLPAYAISTAASLGVLMKSFSQREREHAIHAGPIPGGKFCIIDGGLPSYTYAYWIANLSFDCLLCTLALVRGYRYFKARGSGARLIDILIRDSLFYFLVIGIIYCACLIVWIVDLARFDAPIGFSVAISASLCNRLVLKVHSMQPGKERTDRYAV